MNYKFSNLLGAPYRGGNLLIHENYLFYSFGNLISVVRLSVLQVPVYVDSGACPRHTHSSHINTTEVPQLRSLFIVQVDLTASTSTTLPVESLKQVQSS